MKSISNLLSKFTKLINDSKEKIEIIRQVIKENTGIEIPAESITQQKNTLFIAVHPAVKSDIFLNKDKILKALKEQKITVSDIR